jgi:[ribosomal protein S18]-alanine N-acetyltransferase
MIARTWRDSPLDKAASVHATLSASTSTPLAVEIEPANWRDLGALVPLDRLCFGPDAWNAVELLFALIGPVVRLKAVSGGRLVGFVMGDPRPVQEVAWISTLCVHPDFQRRGIGARLLSEAEARLAMPRIKLTVRRSNTGAIELYRKFGYQPIAVWERYYARGEAGIVMEKQHRG